MSFATNNEETQSELERMEIELGEIAGVIRSISPESEIREVWLERYHATFNKMFEFGWRGKLIWEFQLPWNLMPEKYREMHPEPERAAMYTEDDYRTPCKIEYEPIEIITGRFNLALFRLKLWFKRLYKKE